ncbi:MAG TPA: DUF3365 domain-containing protein [Pseudolabrys sp.]|jgi:hypothetical protein
MSSLHFRCFRAGVFAITTLACAFGILGLRPLHGQTSDDVQVAESLSTLLQAARTVVSRHQDEINNPNVGDKGFIGEKVLRESVAAYKGVTGIDPTTIDPSTRQGRLLRAQMASIVEVVDANQQTINKKGLGFKAFIPATFGRLVNEAFSRRAGHEADVKVTAPSDRIRNLKARADAWEQRVITEKFLSEGWPKGKDFSAVAESRGRQAFRMAVPEYYAASCLSCHGGPKGDIDVTGYPKEGGNEGDLGGVISISLYR